MRTQARCGTIGSSSTSVKPAGTGGTTATGSPSAPSGAGARAARRLPSFGSGGARGRDGARTALAPAGRMAEGAASRPARRWARADPERLSWSEAAVMGSTCRAEFEGDRGLLVAQEDILVVVGGIRQRAEDGERDVGGRA